MFVYVGGYTEPDRGGRGEGICVFEMDEATGSLRQIQVQREASNPSFLALAPDDRFVFAANGGSADGASSFAIELASGSITPINHQGVGSSNPAHICVAPDGRHVLTANYSGGTVSVLPVDAGGRLGPPSQVLTHDGPTGPHRRQDMPHPHMALFDPTHRFALVNDLGLDRTYIYRLEGGGLVPNEHPFGQARPGAGPRHAAFHPNGRFLYVINELDSTVAAFTWDAEQGALLEFDHASTLPDGYAGESTTAQVVVHPSGQFVYGSNRGHDSIAIFSIDQTTGHLTPLGHESTRGRTPRNFDVDPTGRFLFAANQDSDTIVGFRIDGQTGALEPTGQVISVGSPTCVVFRSSTRPSPPKLGR
jgi:6-phosphogluconolactonase (cycloisomerase 2 family)